MPNLPYRGFIPLGTVLASLLWSRPADAQYEPPRTHGGWVNTLVTGANVEITDRAKAERHLYRLETKLQRDAARGRAAAVDRDARGIDRTRFRIAVDNWLIHYNLCQELGPYPYPLRLDPVTCAAIGQYRYLPGAP